MKNYLKKLFVILAVLCGVASIVITINFFYLMAHLGEVMDPQETEDQMVSYVIYWSRLANIPQEATGFTITPKGSSFTRSYQGSFILEKNILERWIKESPGLQDADVEIIEPGVKKYIIRPHKAIYAEVIIYEKAGKVDYKAIWS